MCVLPSKDNTVQYPVGIHVLPGRPEALFKRFQCVGCQPRSFYSDLSAEPSPMGVSTCVFFPHKCS